LWLKHGGQFTLDSYQNISKEEKEIHLQFFSKMKNFIIDSQKRLFIHAGFSSMHGPDREHYHTNYSWDRTLWETALALHGKISKDDPHYPKRLRLFKEIFIGHTPTTEWGETRPWNRMNVWNVDTGAAFKGRLSVLDLDTKQQWQSDKLPSLYPLEKGRN
jgi:serine/threonine protein phosphatase 1